MYRFVFYFIYKYQLIDSPGKLNQSRFVSGIMVTLAIWIHFILLFAIVKYINWNYFGGKTSLGIPHGYAEGMGVTSLIMVPMMFVVYSYFNANRIDSIAAYYEGKRVYSFKNWLKFIAIYLLPILVSIYFGNHSTPGYYDS